VYYYLLKKHVYYYEWLNMFSIPIKLTNLDFCSYKNHMFSSQNLFVLEIGPTLLDNRQPKE
jgi:hypothetical protein